MVFNSYIPGGYLVQFLVNVFFVLASFWSDEKERSLAFSSELDLTAGVEPHFGLLFLLQIIVKTPFSSPQKRP
jgi:hypothetical protein